MCSTTRSRYPDRNAAPARLRRYRVDAAAVKMLGESALDAFTVDRLLPLLSIAMIALMGEGDTWLTEPIIGWLQTEARMRRAQILGEDIAALARAALVVLRNHQLPQPAPVGIAPPKP